MLAQIFVDYDNTALYRPERTDDECYASLGSAIEKVKCFAKDRLKGAGVTELELRLYGGWIDVAGHPTERHLRLARCIRKIPTRICGLRLTAEIITRPINVNQALVGSYKDGGQKMVDTMIVADILWCAYNWQSPMLVLSDDDDIIPGVLGAAVHASIRGGTMANQIVALGRSRTNGEGLNDKLLTTSGVYWA